MRFSDPFNRVSCRQETEYQKFYRQLQDLGIDGEDKVLSMLRRSRKNMLFLGVIVLSLCALSSLIWPQASGISMVFGILLLLWTGVTWLRGERLLKRYLQQLVAAEK